MSEGEARILILGIKRALQMMIAVLEAWLKVHPDK